MKKTPVQNLLKKYMPQSAGILTVFLMSLSFNSNSQLINTIGGDGTGGYFGDGGQATAAELYLPDQLVVDASGTVYVADHQNSCIRTINSSGIINTIAGNGVIGSSGDGGPATAAEFEWPTGVGVDGSGNIYIADYHNNRIRKVNTSGIISTFAGTTSGFSGDGAAATAAQLYDPQGVTVDNHGNVLIADRENGRIREVNTSGIITTISGNGFGFYGDGGPASAAEFFAPTGVTVDVSGNIYIADQQNNRVRKINTSGIISTLAGNGYNAHWQGGYYGDGGPATAAELFWPTSIAVDTAGNVFVADSGNNCIRKINPQGIISTVAGNSASGFYGDGGLATAAELQGPQGVALDTRGNIYIGDSYNNRVRKVTNNVLLGVTETISVSNLIDVYPLPNSGSFTISGIDKGQVIEIYNTMGQKLSSIIADNSAMHLDISNNPNGIYLIRIQNKDGSLVTQKKMVKAQ